MLTVVISISTNIFTRTYGDVLMEICDILRDLIPFDQFKKREKHP